MVVRGITSYRGESSVELVRPVAVKDAADRAAPAIVRPAFGIARRATGGHDAAGRLEDARRTGRVARSETVRAPRTRRAADLVRGNPGPPCPICDGRDGSRPRRDHGAEIRA